MITKQIVIYFEAYEIASKIIEKLPRKKTFEEKVQEYYTDIMRNQ